MKLDTRAFALAAGTAGAIAFAICAAFVAVAAGPTTAFLGFITHTDLGQLARPLTWESFIGGLVAWWLIVAAVFGLAGWLYNRFVDARVAYPGIARPAERHG